MFGKYICKISFPILKRGFEWSLDINLEMVTYIVMALVVNQVFWLLIDLDTVALIKERSSTYINCWLK